MVARPWSSSRLSCGEPLLLRCDGNAGNSFPTTQEKDPSSRARRRKRGSSGCGRDSRASSRAETGMSGNFLSCSQGVKDPLEVPDVRCDLPGDASAEMGLISPGGENLLDFLELRQVLLTYDGTSGTRSGGLRKGQYPCELLGCLSGFLSRGCRCLRPCVEPVPEPEDSSPMLTCILGYFCSFPRGVSPGIEWGHARVLSSRAVAAVSRFPSRGSRDLWLSLEAFPRGFLSRLSHRAVPRATVV